MPTGGKPTNEKELVQEYKKWVAAGRPISKGNPNSNLDKSRINSAYNKSANEGIFILMDQGRSAADAYAIASAKSNKVGVTDEDAALATKRQILQEKRMAGATPWALPNGKLAPGWTLDKQGRPVQQKYVNQPDSRLSAVMGSIR
ncbi:hypothetical protein D770_15010 [Flammeovirgaceae bacterium 311]|nr:hypothetical protein D770_15010 [Flammeovirgaceae bacterium 311]